MAGTTRAVLLGPGLWRERRLSACVRNDDEGERGDAGAGPKPGEGEPAPVARLPDTEFRPRLFGALCGARAVRRLAKRRRHPVCGRGSRDLARTAMRVGCARRRTERRRSLRLRIRYPA